MEPFPRHLEEAIRDTLGEIASGAFIDFDSENYPRLYLNIEQPSQGRAHNLAHAASFRSNGSLCVSVSCSSLGCPIMCIHEGDRRASGRSRSSVPVVERLVRDAYEEGVDDGAEWATDRIMEPKPQWIDSVARVELLALTRTDEQQAATIAELVDVLFKQGVALAAFVNLLEARTMHVQPFGEVLTNLHDWSRSPTKDEVQMALKAQNAASAALAKVRP